MGGPHLKDFKPSLAEFHAYLSGLPPSTKSGSKDGFISDYLRQDLGLVFTEMDGFEGIEVGKVIPETKIYTEEIAYLELTAELQIFRYVEMDEAEMTAAHALTIVARISAFGLPSDE